MKHIIANHYPSNKLEKVGSKTEAFKKGKTSGNYLTHKQSDDLEKKYREMAKSRALNNAKK